MASGGTVMADIKSKLQLAIDPAERPSIVHEEYVYNFAFGSNIGKEKLTNRGGGIAVESCEPGLVRGHRLAFNLGGIPPLEPTMAGIEPEEGSICHGTLYKLKRDQYEKLYITEGGLGGKSRGYWEHQVTVERYNGEKVEAVAFRVNERYALPRWAELPPSKRYLDLITAGAKSQGLDPKYIEWLESLPRAPPCNPVVQWYARFFAAHYFIWLTKKLPGGAAARKYKGYIFLLYAYAEHCRHQAKQMPLYYLLYIVLMLLAFLGMLPGVLVGMSIMAFRAVRSKAGFRKKVSDPEGRTASTKKNDEGRAVPQANGEAQLGARSSGESKKEA